MTAGSKLIHARRLPVERTVRLSTGLILFTFAASHFLNHACGIFRLDVMEAVRGVLIWPWRTYPGQTLLYGSFFIHASLGLYAIYRRRHLRIPLGELVQLILGLSIPALVILHATNVRLGHFLYGLPESYPRILYTYWDLSPVIGLSRQFTLLLVLWIHGCIGLNSWLRQRQWYQKWLPVLAALVTLVPVLAMVGIAEGGRDFDARSARDQGFLAQVGVQSKAQAAALSTIGNRLILAYLALVAAMFALRAARQWHERRFHAVTITYPNGRSATVPRGFSILEASRWAGIAHTSICGGRGRCSTCRVLIMSGLDHLPVPNAAEMATLVGIGVHSRVRLACQVRPRENIEVVPLLSPRSFGASHPLKAAVAASEEHEIAALFVDLRDSTRLADGRLPYDALYIIDRYVAAITHAVETNSGRITSIAGDGVMCFFGVDCDAPTACRRAILASRQIWQSLDLLNKEFKVAFDFPLRFGAGCHVGLAIVGELASRHTTQFLGEVGNIAARLETLTKELECTIILSHAVIERAGLAAPRSESHRVQIKNVTAEIDLFTLRTEAQLDALIATFH